VVAGGDGWELSELDRAAVRLDTATTLDFFFAGAFAQLSGRARSIGRDRLTMGSSLDDRRSLAGGARRWRSLRSNLSRA